MVSTVSPTTGTHEKAPAMVPDVAINCNTIKCNNVVNGGTVTLTLSWGEPFCNNSDPIVNYTFSCSGDVSCPPNFTTTDNTTRNHIITDLAPMTTYTFSVVATNSIGSGDAGTLMTTIPGKIKGSLLNFECYRLAIIISKLTERIINRLATRYRIAS